MTDKPTNHLDFYASGYVCMNVFAGKRILHGQDAALARQRAIAALDKVQKGDARPCLRRDPPID